MGVQYGTVLNKNYVEDKITGPVAASTKLEIGFVYMDAANGWKNAPTDSSIRARRLYWNETVKDNTNGSKGDLVATCYGDEARVVGKADGAIVVNAAVKTSDTSAHGGQAKSLADPSNASTTPTGAQVDAVRDYYLHKIARYLGHVNEITGVKTTPTDAVDEETDIVLKIERGA